MTIQKIVVLVGVAVLVMVANVAASVLYMVLYGHIIDPGHDPEYYQEHIQMAGPFCSILFGVPILFAAGWWVADWWNRALGYRGAIFVWLVYTVIDLFVLLAVGLTFYIAFLFVVSFGTKLAAVYWGASTRFKRRESIGA